MEHATCDVSANHLAGAQGKQHEASMAGQDLAGEPGGVERVVEAGEEHHGEQEEHAGVGQHLEHTSDLFAQGALLAVDFRAESGGKINLAGRCCEGGSSAEEGRLTWGPGRGG